MKLFRSQCASCAWALVLLLAVTATPAQAQLGLRTPNLQLPQQIGPIDQDLLRRPGGRLLSGRELELAEKMVGQRLGAIASLLQRHPAQLEADPAGEPVVRNEILAWSPSPAGLAQAAAMGLTIARRGDLAALGGFVVFQVPSRADTADALAQLRERDPNGDYDFNHVYTGSGSATGGIRAPQPAAGAAAAAGTAATVATGTVATAAAGTVAKAGGAAVAVGLVDSGVDASHPVFRDARLHHWGCEGSVQPASHGTEVAALMVGQSAQMRGVAPQARLYAADVYCNSASGGSVDKIAQALAWLAAEQIAVINLSLVGPPNRTLERVVAAMLRRGHVLVAAVGNDGPAAPPLYPAAYPGVVGVSAVDPHGRALPEAARGPHVMFAAPGSKVVSATTGSPPYCQVRGTSFAAPIVAAMLAISLHRPDPAQAKHAIGELARRAVKGGSELGLGTLGGELRTMRP